MLRRVCGHAEEALAQADHAEDRRQVQGRANAVHDLDHGLVQAQRDADDQAEERGRAENRKEREGAADRQGERNFFRGDPLGELKDDRMDDPALPERRLRLGRGGRGRKGFEDTAGGDKLDGTAE